MKAKIKHFIITAAIIGAFFIGRKFPGANDLDMKTVVSYEATETGLMLYTQTGEGYYWEK